MAIAANYASKKQNVLAYFGKIKAYCQHTEQTNWTDWGQ